MRVESRRCIHPTFCCSKLCDSCDCFAQVTPKFDRVCNVENQMSTPITRVRSAVSAIIAPVILNQMRLDERAAPGSEMRKVTKVITPAAMTPRRQSYQPFSYESSEKISVPVRGVCISSMLAATLSIVGALAMAALVMNTTPISRPPEAKNKKS